MRIALVSGIFPPDIGGPATHAQDLRAELADRGHEVTVLTLWDGPRTDPGPGVVRYPRGWSWPARAAAVGAWLVRNAAGYDVVYATGLQPAAVAGARAAGRPIVVKVVGDLAWERGRRLGLTHADYDAFQAGDDGSDPRIRAMRRLQAATLRAADEITAPSDTLRATIEGWLGGPVPVEVIPNGVRASTPPRPRAPGGGFVVLARLVPHKRIDRIVEAAASIEQARLEILGEGPEASSLAGLVGALGAEDRIALRGPVPHDEAMARLADASALVLASDYEGLPHVVLEALAVGTPVLSPPVGGVPEVVTDGASGLLLSDAGVGTLAGAMRRVLEDRELAGKLRAGALEAGRSWRIERTADRVEDLLRRAIAGRPRAVFLGKTPVAPATPDLRRKLRILTPHLRTRLIGIGRPGVRSPGAARTIALPAAGPRAVSSVLFYGAGPLLAVAAASGRRPSAIVCQGPFEAIGTSALLAVVPRAVRPRLVVELHGDWRSATRLYGGPGRGVLSSIADRAAEAALRRADRLRSVGTFTEGLARDAGWSGAIDRFPAFGDHRRFLDAPVVDPPAGPRVLFAGALERVKGVDVLLDAWSRVRDRVPDARLTIAGAGPLGREVRDRAGALAGVEVVGSVPHARVRPLLDAATVVVAPSRSEGLGRVVLEAFARGRPVVASEVGGLPELVHDGANGVLVPPEDPEALAAALATVLTDASRASAMGARARADAIEIDPDRAFEDGVERLARWIAGP